MSTVSLVTGGNRGIGREVCRQLAGRGHAVVLTARSAAAAAPRRAPSVPNPSGSTSQNRPAWPRPRAGSAGAGALAPRPRTQRRG